MDRENKEATATFKEQGAPSQTHGSVEGRQEGKETPEVTFLIFNVFITIMM